MLASATSMSKFLSAIPVFLPVSEIPEALKEPAHRENANHLIIDLPAGDSLGCTPDEVFSFSVVTDPEQKELATVTLWQAAVVPAPGRIATSRIESGPSCYLTREGVRALKLNSVNPAYAKWRLS